VATREKGLYSAASLRWFTYYSFRHCELPNEATSGVDYLVLRTICDEHALGNEDRALRTIEALIDAPVPGDSLAVRFAHFLAWIDARCPKKYHAPSAYALRQYREIARGAA
jgi:hypothetical protein